MDKTSPLSLKIDIKINNTNTYMIAKTSKVALVPTFSTNMSQALLT